jgi:hypothetical protein
LWEEEDKVELDKFQEVQNNVQQRDEAIHIFKLHQPSKPVRVDSGRVECKILAQNTEQLFIFVRVLH